MLEADLRVLVYSGQFDLVCNHLGTERMLENLPWSGQQGFLRASSGVWELDQRPAGYVRAFKNLQLLLGECARRPASTYRPEAVSVCV